MKKIISVAASFALLSLNHSLAQSFDDEGTAYSTAGVEIWTEDEANELVAMPSSFACIIKNTRGDVLPNASWEALIDEEDCGLADADDRAATQYARGVFTSTRADNSSPQSVTGWFESLSGFKYIADVEISAPPSDDNPAGEWTFAFYNSGEDGSVGPSDSDDIGFVDVAEADDGAVTITTATSYTVPDGPDAGTVEEDAALIKYNADDTVSFVGLRAEDGGQAIAGKANDDFYYRVNFSGNSIDVEGLKSGSVTALAGLANASTSDACFRRNNPWQSVNRYDLFTEAGARVELNGGFGFETGASGDGTNGYMGNWGVWMDTENSLFSPTNNSIAIRADVPGEDERVNRTLEWASGKLYRLETVIEPLLNGTTYRTWAPDNSFNWEEVDAVYNASEDRFDLTKVSDGEAYGDITVTDAQNNPWLARFWSPEKQTEILWAFGETDPDQITFEKRADLSKDATILENGITLAALYDGGPDTGLPIAAASSARENFMQGSANDSYILTSRAPGDGFESRTLYIDNDGTAGLTANDDPVRYDFSTSWSMTGQNYQSYSDQNDSGEFTGFWPYESFKLYDPNDDDCDTPTSGDCTKYEWSFGAMEWDHSIIAAEEDGDLVQIDPPIFFEYTHAAANERNGDQSFSFRSVDENNPAAHTIGNDSSFLISDDTFDDKKYYLEYDGNSLHGLPNIVIGDNEYGHWVSLINLADGTQLTAEGGNTTYRVKAVEVSESLVEANISECESAGVKFTDPTSLGITITDVPDVDDGTLPTALWSEIPTDENLTCTVTHGDAGNCSSN